MTGKGDGVQRPRRFYKAVTTGPVEGGFAPLLDGRSPRTPAGRKLVLPTEALAALVAADWDAQVVEVDPARMPAMRLAATAIDRVADVSEEVAAEVSRYAGSDLLSYRAENPEGLVVEQARAWDPLLAWAAEELGVALETTSGILHHAQPAGSLERARGLAAGMDPFSLTAVAHASALFGSAVLALALRAGRVTGTAAHDLARVDEAWQEQRWGVDHEAADRTAARLAEAQLLDAWFMALR